MNVRRHRRRRDQGWKPPEGTPCPICQKPMIRSNRHARRPSRDHIIAKELNGSNDPENKRIICQDCNTLRAFAAHCVGALACARSVAEASGGGTRNSLIVLKKWKLRNLDPRL